MTGEPIKQKRKDEHGRINFGIWLPCANQIEADYVFDALMNFRTQLKEHLEQIDRRN